MIGITQSSKDGKSFSSSVISTSTKFGGVVLMMMLLFHFLLLFAASQHHHHSTMLVEARLHGALVAAAVGARYYSSGINFPLSNSRDSSIRDIQPTVAQKDEQEEDEKSILNSHQHRSLRDCRQKCQRKNRRQKCMERCGGRNDGGRGRGGRKKKDKSKGRGGGGGGGGCPKPRGGAVCFKIYNPVSCTGSGNKACVYANSCVARAAGAKRCRPK